MNKREGNTLSVILRNAWDGKPLSTLTRKDPLTCRKPNVSVIGHITSSEIKGMVGVGAQNGFSNRFLIVPVHRMKKLPLGGSLEPGALDSVADAVKIATGEGGIQGKIGFSADATELWKELYGGELEPPDHKVVGALLARSHAQVRRLALIYTVLDGSGETTVKHLDAALAIWRHSRDGILELFGDTCGHRIGDKILEFRSYGWRVSGLEFSQEAR